MWWSAEPTWNEAEKQIEPEKYQSHALSSNFLVPKFQNNDAFAASEFVNPSIIKIFADKNL